ncbi:MAG: N-acetylglucosamine-6-phosphate deacetylase [Fimbriimonas sp.]
MSRTYLALGPDGFGSYTLEEGTLVHSNEVGENLLVPGFVDVHIHGAFGVDFMSASREDLLRMFEGLAALGYEGLLPTTVTASASDVRAALANLPDDPMVLGFHLEGPFISPKFPGAQPPKAIVPPPLGASEWDAILDDPRLRLVTLAPELEGALPLIERLHRRGVIVSMGHTNATFVEAQAGLEAGVRHATHTYNAMRPLHHREAGTVGFCLTQDEVMCELIYDRLHVSREAAAVLVRCKPPERLVAISDSTLASGIPAGQTIRMWGLDAIVGDGQVRLPDGTLAGSAITLLDAFRNLHADFGAEVAIRACSINPRRELGFDPLRPRVWVEFGRDLEIVGFR